MTDLIHALQLAQQTLESAHRQLKIMAERCPGTTRQWARGEAKAMLPVLAHIQATLRAHS